MTISTETLFTAAVTIGVTLLSLVVVGLVRIGSTMQAVSEIRGMVQRLDVHLVTQIKELSRQMHDAHTNIERRLDDHTERLTRSEARLSEHARQIERRA